MGASPGHSSFGFGLGRTIELCPRPRSLSRCPLIVMMRLGRKSTLGRRGRDRSRAATQSARSERSTGTPYESCLFTIDAKRLTWIYTATFAAGRRPQGFETLPEASVEHGSSAIRRQ